MSKFDLYQTVTDRVIALMTTHGANWVNPFKKRAGMYTPHNPITGKAYQGINTFLLATTPFPSPQWAGFGQWADKKCFVRKGEKSTMIVYWKILENKKTVAGVETVSTRPLLRYLNVFNIDQVDGEWADKLRVDGTLPAIQTDVETSALADAFFSATGAKIVSTEKGRAFYSPAGDYIHMPNRELFEATPTSSATECYYSTLAHEMTHWTGNAARLARDFTGRFGTMAYAFEELVAELGAAMLCAQLGVSVEPRPDHAHYLANWLKVLKDDSGAIIKAATLAKLAVAFLSKTSEVEQEEAA